MKKLIISACVLLVTGCAVDRQILSKEDLKNWESNRDTLYYRTVPVAVFTGYEMELYNGKMTKELCLEQINDTMVPIDEIVLYVHTRHREDKVQVVSTYSKNKQKYGK